MFSSNIRILIWYMKTYCIQIFKVPERVFRLLAKDFEYLKLICYIYTENIVLMYAR